MVTALKRAVCFVIGHDYTMFFRCLRCEPKSKHVMENTKAYLEGYADGHQDALEP